MNGRPVLGLGPINGIPSPVAFGRDARDRLRALDQVADAVAVMGPIDMDDVPGRQIDPQSLLLRGRRPLGRASVEGERPTWGIGDGMGFWCCDHPG